MNFILTLLNPLSTGKQRLKARHKRAGNKIRACPRACKHANASARQRAGKHLAQPCPSQNIDSRQLHVLTTELATRTRGSRMPRPEHDTASQSRPKNGYFLWLFFFVDASTANDVVSPSSVRGLFCGFDACRVTAASVGCRTE